MMTMFGYFVITGHSVGLDNAYSDIPHGIKQLLHLLTAVNMRKKPLLTLEIFRSKNEILDFCHFIEFVIMI